MTILTPFNELTWEERRDVLLVFEHLASRSWRDPKMTADQFLNRISEKNVVRQYLVGLPPE